MRRGRFYLARVVKLGELTQELLIDAIANAPVVPIGQFAWTITDVVDQRGAQSPYLFGNLAKFSREGAVTIIDEPAKRQLQALAPNLLEASAPFVYLPEFSGLAYLHVWNGIPEDVFPRRFKSVVESTYNNFFVDCTIEPVADYRQFLQKLRSLDRISELSAKVHPPNPLFGRLWASLDDYVRKRNAEEVAIRESTSDQKGLDTKLPELIAGMLDNKDFEPAAPASITDAAMLMAADGYGSGKAVGRDGDQDVVIRTSETQKSFLFQKVPNPDALAAAVRTQFERISRERDMRH